MLPGYNTNGFAHHPLLDAIEILAELGYRSVALTMDYLALDPFSADYRAQIEAVGSRLRDTGLRCVVETGARFLLDRWRKHQPTLLDPDPVQRQRRVAFLEAAIDLAADLNADAVSFWSGTTPVPEADDDALMARLADGCRHLCAYAERRGGVRLAFEPEPGMLIDT